MIRGAPMLPSVLALLACRPSATECVQPNAGSRTITPTLVERVMPSDIGVPPQPGEARFLDSRMHTAFFSVDPERGLTQPNDRCMRWGVIGSRWWALDEWGAVVGEFELERGSGLQASNCYGLEFVTIAGGPGSGLLVTGNYRAPESARWELDANQLALLEGYVAEIDALFGTPYDPPSSIRMLSYRRSDPELEPNEADRRRSREWVVVGGPWLGVFSWELGNWWLRQLDTRVAIGDRRLLPGQERVAAIDLDGDGDPELIVHESDGEHEYDVLLRPAGLLYERVFESPGLR